MYSSKVVRIYSPFTADFLLTIALVEARLFTLEALTRKNKSTSQQHFIGVLKTANMNRQLALFILTGKEIALHLLLRFPGHRSHFESTFLGFLPKPIVMIIGDVICAGKKNRVTTQSKLKTAQ